MIFYIKKIYFWLYRFALRNLRLLKFERPVNVSATIISDNCLSGSIYKAMNSEFLSPTIGLFIPGPDFVKFCKDLPYYLKVEPKQIVSSRYSGSVDYPLGALDDVELHFLHYHSFEDAKAKWVKRSQRVNYRNIFLTMTDRDWTSPNDRMSFLNLQYNNKLYFSAERLQCSNVVWCWRYKLDKEIGVITTDLEFLDYFDLCKWLDFNIFVQKV